MNRKLRTKLLIESSSSVAHELAREITNKYELEIIQPAEEALTMIKVRETAENSLFYIGEVLVSECKVRINGHVGIGLVKGLQLELAYDLAVIDAAYNGSLEETQAWTSIFERLENELAEAENVRIQELSRTRVSFETMNQ